MIKNENRILMPVTDKPYSHRAKHIIKCIILMISIASTILTVCGCNKNESGSENVAKQEEEKAKIEYLNSKIDELEQQILTMRGNSYVSDAAYREEIVRLRNEISALQGEPKAETTEQGKAPNDNSTEQSRTENLEGTEAYISSEQSEPYADVSLRYTVSDGKATITGYIGSSDTLVIPQTLGGYPVAAISDKAFYRSAFKKITISEGLTYIGWFAFSESILLEEIVIPKTVLRCEYGIFEGCSSALRVRCHEDSYIYTYVKSYGIKTAAL